MNTLVIGGIVVAVIVIAYIVFATRKNKLRDALKLIKSGEKEQVIISQTLEQTKDILNAYTKNVIFTGQTLLFQDKQDTFIAVPINEKETLLSLAPNDAEVEKYANIEKEILNKIDTESNNTETMLEKISDVFEKKETIYRDTPLIGITLLEWLVASKDALENNAIHIALERLLYAYSLLHNDDDEPRKHITDLIYYVNNNMIQKAIDSIEDTNYNIANSVNKNIIDLEKEALVEFNYRINETEKIIKKRDIAKNNLKTQFATNKIRRKKEETNKAKDNRLILPIEEPAYYQSGKIIVKTRKFNGIADVWEYLDDFTEEIVDDELIEKINNKGVINTENWIESNEEYDLDHYLDYHEAEFIANIHDYLDSQEEENLAIHANNKAYMSSKQMDEKYNERELHNIGKTSSFFHNINPLPETIEITSGPTEDEILTVRKKCDELVKQLNEAESLAELIEIIDLDLTTYEEVDAYKDWLLNYHYPEGKRIYKESIEYNDNDKTSEFYEEVLDALANAFRLLEK